MAILDQLPAKDLLLDKRVSRSWYMVIDGSTRLQNNLFLQAKPVGSLWAARKELKRGPPKDFYLLGALPCDRVVHHPSIEYDVLTPITLNPMVCESESFIVGGLLDLIPAFGVDVRVHIPFDTKQDSGNEREITPSWHRMYLTQPPQETVVLGLWLESDEEFYLGWVYLKCKRAGGVTLGDMCADTMTRIKELEAQYGNQRVPVTFYFHVRLEHVVMWTEEHHAQVQKRTESWLREMGSVRSNR